MDSKLTFGNNHTDQRREGVSSTQEKEPIKTATSFKDIPREVVGDSIIPATKAIGGQALRSLGEINKQMHAQVIRATAVPLVVALRKQIAASAVPSLPNDIAVHHAAEGIIFKGANLGESMYALRRLEKLFELRGFKKSSPVLAHGPLRHEAWSLSQIETALQTILDGSQSGPLNFPAGLPEAISNLKAATMRPLLQWKSQELAGSRVDEIFLDKTISDIRENAEHRGKKLNFYDSNYSQMPPIWLYAKHVESLAINASSLRVIPLELRDLENLRTLNLTLHQFRGDLFLNLPVGLRDLHIVGADIGQMAPDLLRLVHLERLSLIGCNVRSLPEEVSQLKKLTFLGLGSNSLNEIPSQLFSLHSLRELDLSSNGIASVPDGFKALKSLNKLDLSSNQLRGTMSGIDDFQELEYLNLNHNSITELSSGFGKLGNLQTLSIQQTELKGIPEIIAELGGLRQLGISRRVVDKNEIKQFEENFRANHNRKAPIIG